MLETSCNNQATYKPTAPRPSQQRQRAAPAHLLQAAQGAQLLLARRRHHVGHLVLMVVVLVENMILGKQGSLEFGSEAKQPDER